MSQCPLPAPDPVPEDPPGRVIRGPWPTVPPEPAPPSTPAAVTVPAAPRVHCRAHWSSSGTAGYFLILGTILAAFVVGLFLRWTVFAPIGVG